MRAAWELVQIAHIHNSAHTFENFRFSYRKNAMQTHDVIDVYLCNLILQRE